MPLSQGYTPGICALWSCRLETQQSSKQHDSDSNDSTSAAKARCYVVCSCRILLYQSQLSSAALNVPQPAQAVRHQHARLLWVGELLDS